MSSCARRPGAPERRRRRTQHAELAAPAVRLPQPLNDVGGVVHGAGECSRADDGVDDRDERRVAHRAAELQLAGVERRVVLLHALNAVMIGIQGSDDGFARLLAAACRPATCVNSWNVRSEARKSAMPRPTSADTTPTSDARKIVSLRDHLGPDEHVDLAVAESRQQRAQGAPTANGVAIEPGHAGRRAPALDCLYPLGAESSLLQIGAGDSGHTDGTRAE